MDLIRPLNRRSSVVPRLVLEGSNNVGHVDVLDSLDRSTFGLENWKIEEVALQSLIFGNLREDEGRCADLMIVVEVFRSDVFELVDQPIGRYVDLSQFLA